MTKKSSVWICTVCGYVHNGDEPPEYCPVCGATSDLFEPQPETEKGEKKTIAIQWRCLNCEYIHEGTEAPGYCPVCGAPAERFEPYHESPVAASTDQKKQRVVIVGAGIAGVSAAEAVRKTSTLTEIILVSKEPELPYYRLNLTRYLAGEIEEPELYLHDKNWYEKNNIQLIHNVEMVKLDTGAKKLYCRGCNDLTYDRVIITMGSHPFVPPFPGVNKTNVTTLRTKSDADKILEEMSKNLNCVVIGGGLLGLETAAALARRDVNVTLLEGYGWLLPRQLNQKAGDILQKRVEELGIKIMLNIRTKEILGDERVREVRLEDGNTSPADLVIITTGVRSNSYIARLAGLDVNRGLVVNNFLQTSDASVFAAGDVAEHRGITYGIWGPSLFQGTIAGANACGATLEFAGIPRSNMLKVLGYDLFSMGQITPEDASFRTIEGISAENYYYFLFHDNHLAGFILLGDTRLSAQAKTLLENKTDCSQILQTNPTHVDLLTYLKG